ncbi:hypothetical protein ACFX1S_040963 [Malus domestica]
MMCSTNNRVYLRNAASRRTECVYMAVDVGVQVVYLESDLQLLISKFSERQCHLRPETQALWKHMEGV